MIHDMRVCKQSQFVVSLALAILLTTTAGAWAQSIQTQVPPPPALPSQPVPPQPVPQQNIAPPDAPPAPPPAVEAAPRENPGLINELGKLFRDSASGISSSLKGSQQTIEDLNARAKGAAKDAADNLKMTPQTVVTGRATCPVAGNGAPDCKAAADKICKTKGYKEGKSVDIETAETCSAKVYLSGRTGAPGECKTENFVTRAVCQ